MIFTPHKLGNSFDWLIPHVRVPLSLLVVLHKRGADQRLTDISNRLVTQRMLYDLILIRFGASCRALSLQQFEFWIPSAPV